MKLVPLAASAVFLVACEQNNATPASVAFTAPAKDAVLTDTNVVVHLSATGLKIVPATNPVTAGEGHHHIFVDVDPSADSMPIMKGVAGVYHLGKGEDSLALTLAPGKHRLIDVPAASDHVPIKGARRDTLNIEIKAPATPS